MAEADDIMIKCINVSKSFRDFWMRVRVAAVSDLTMDVRRGEVFGLLGPNGSGKSTTIKMILGLLKPTSGKIAVLGKRPEDVRIKEEIGYLPEESYLYKFLSARETLDYYGRLFHQSSAKRAKRIDMLLEMVGLTHAARRPVGEFSKGMQRRIGLAQALINDPQLLILDEPTTGMDPIGTRQIKDLIRSLADRGKTVLLCSHLLPDVEDVCDRVSIMFGGKLRAMGDIDELLTSSHSTRISLPELDVETLEAISNTLEARGVRDFQVEQPRQRLEDLFLDIVNRAQREGLRTEGSTAGGRIAGFLADGDDGEAARTDADRQAAAVIDDLVAKPQPKPAAPRGPGSLAGVAPVPSPQEAAPAKPAVDNAVLDQLTKGEDDAKRQPLPSEATESDSAPKPDTGLIDSLIDKDKK